MFDFDGTITNRDSFIEFIRYTCSNRAFITGFIRMSPLLAMYKAGFIPNWKAKEAVMSYFWGGMELEEFNRKGEEFAENILPSICRQAAIDRIREYQSEGWEVVVVSASASNWLKSWAHQLRVKLIATELLIEEGRVTGKIDGRNCYGPEKVARLQTLYRLEDFGEIHAFGDSSGDREMLQIAHRSHYKPFRV